LVTQSRSASFIASLRVRVPLSTAITRAPRSFMRNTLSDWRATSSAPMYTSHGMPNSAATVAGRDAVLAGAGLGDQPALAHAARQERLADAVVDLVSAGVVQVLALEQDGGADLGAEALGPVQARRAPDVVGQERADLGAEPGVDPRDPPGRLELGQGRHERLGDVLTAELAEAAARSGIVSGGEDHRTGV
jgi:hypothetical protein